MKRRLLLLLIPFLTFSCKQVDEEALWLQGVLDDPLMAQVDSMARAVAATGFNAGDGYKEVWIRDLNTFICLSLQVMDTTEVRDALDTFLDFQGPEGDIPDAFVSDVDTSAVPYRYRYSRARPKLAAHKNTVETDQESSLVQAACQYVKMTGDTAWLASKRGGKTVLQRLEDAMSYLRNRKWNDEYGLITGATTADWGDVQPEHGWGVEIDEHTHYAIDIYDNAMWVLALGDLAELCREAGANSPGTQWLALKEEVKANVRKYLWDPERRKFHPHLYLDGSPFPEELDEEAIYYHGGTAVAALAGILSREEVAEANARMLENVAAAGAQSIGLTLYPAYPSGTFANPMMGAYQYQNGGDWTWFGARMIQALVQRGFLHEAYDELQPMLQRVADQGGFYEWYKLDGTPVGSGTYRGAAGVLFKADEMLRAAARKKLEPKP
jgi:cellobiose phosphorylase